MFESPVKFSIVIPTYNREKFIIQTLNSIFQQTYQNFEIIVVDNCSTDATEAILQPYINRRQIHFIRHEQNYERARSRNTGMDNATGHFVTFLDSDDFMYSNNLADAAEFIKNNPESKCFHNLYELINNQNKVLRKYKFPPQENQIKAIASGNFLSCIGNFIHRDIYQNYRFDCYQPLTGAEDWEFWLRVLADYKLGRIEKVNSAILHHNSRTISTQDFKVLEKGFEYLINKFYNDAHLSRIYNKNLSWISSNSYLYLAVLANGGKFFADARWYIKKAVKKDWRVIFSSRFARILRRNLLQIKETPLEENSFT